MLRIFANLMRGFGRLAVASGALCMLALFLVFAANWWSSTHCVRGAGVSCDIALAIIHWWWAGLVYGIILMTFVFVALGLYQWFVVKHHEA